MTHMEVKEGMGSARTIGRTIGIVSYPYGCLEISFGLQEEQKEQRAQKDADPAFYLFTWNSC